MCGITGWVAFRRDLTEHCADLQSMTETMACRGPDEGGTWSSRHAAMGHRRLSVIDVNGGRQPMVEDTDEGSVVLAYSGEVYNFVDLRNELQRRGHAFRTRSDTEVVLRGYLEWGSAVADRLNGMYAFGIWDGRLETLILIRDRMGVKPLYYAATDDGVLFGSEPKTILANSFADRSVDLDGMRELASFTSTPGSAVWSGMNEVLPGAMLTLDRSGMRERRYWSLEARPHTDDKQTTISTVRNLLDASVGRQLVSDVPLCTLLSGGLDSSVITALTAKRLQQHGQQVRSFAVDFVGRDGEFVADDIRPTADAPYAREVAEYLGARHQTVVLDSTAIADREIRRRVITARDSPLSLGDMDTSLYLFFNEVRKHSTVAVSGESADELFGGYPWFHRPKARDSNTFPWMSVVFHGRPAGVSNRFNTDLTKALDLPNFIEDQYTRAVSEVEVLDGECASDTRMRVISYLNLTRFVRMLLERMDRVSMAVGLEVRVPFCDHRLIEYVYNAPWSLKAFDGREKSLLRAASVGLLPDSILNRTKASYPATLDPLYIKSLLSQAKELLSDNDPVFELVDRQWFEQVARYESTAIPNSVRDDIEGVLDLSTWLEVYRPTLRLL